MWNYSLTFSNGLHEDWVVSADREPVTFFSSLYDRCLLRQTVRLVGYCIGKHNRQPVRLDTHFYINRSHWTAGLSEFSRTAEDIYRSRTSVDLTPATRSVYVCLAKQ